MCQNSDQRRGLSSEVYLIRRLLRLNEGEKGRSRLPCSTLRFLRRGRSATGSLQDHRVSGSLRSSAVKTRPLRLRCFPKVISENPAKTFPTLNAPLNAGTVGHFAGQPVVETLVISFQMIMSDVSANGRAKMILSERRQQAARWRRATRARLCGTYRWCSPPTRVSATTFDVGDGRGVMALAFGMSLLSPKWQRSSW